MPVTEGSDQILCFTPAFRRHSARNGKPPTFGRFAIAYSIAFSSFAFGFMNCLYQLLHLFRFKLRTSLRRFESHPKRAGRSGIRSRGTNYFSPPVPEIIST